MPGLSSSRLRDSLLLLSCSGLLFLAVLSHLSWRQQALLTLEAPSASPTVGVLGIQVAHRPPAVVMRTIADMCSATLNQKPARALFHPAGP